MRIGIDATGLLFLEDGSNSGIVTYVVQITNNLLEIDKENSYYIYCFKDIPKDVIKDAPNAIIKKFKPRNRKAWQQLILPIVAYFDNLDIMYFPGNAASLFTPCKSVATIHDLHPIVIRNPFNKVHSQEIHGNYIRSYINRIYWILMMRLLSKKNRIIAVSHATKKDVEKYFKVSGKKIDVVYEGVDLVKFSHELNNADIINFRNKYGLENKYILCVGTHGYKNLAGSVKAFSIIKQKINDQLNLVIAGSLRTVSKDIFSLVNDLNLEKDIIFTGFFPNNDFKYLYRCAELLLFPSFYEGFGLPVLEAFACGVAVVTSRKGSLPEVGGDAVLFVEPNDPEDIAKNVLHLLGDKKLRMKKIEAGFLQLNRFSWQKAAIETLNVFEKVHFIK